MMGGFLLLALILVAIGVILYSRKPSPVPPQARAPSQPCRCCDLPVTEHFTRCGACHAVYHRSCWRSLLRCIACEPAERCVRCDQPSGSNLVRCPKCRAVHHANCWRQAGRCAAPGCAPGEEVRIVEAVDAPSIGKCQVCGSDMKSDLVQCRKCRTSHHRACWTYYGKCSTYACASKTADETSRSAKRDDVVIIEDPRERKNRIRIWMEHIASSLSNVQRESTKRGRYRLRFERAGVRCILAARRTGTGWTIRFHALFTPEQRRRVEVRTAVANSIHRSFGSDDQMTLEPAVDFETAEQFQGFFWIACSMVDAASRSQDPDPARNDLDIHR